MMIFKATLYRDGHNTIDPVDCEKINDKTVIFIRDNSDSRMSISSTQRVEARSSKFHIFCEKERECVEWVNAKYEEQLRNYYSCIAKVKEYQLELMSA
jgi:hypothetical protein